MPFLLPEMTLIITTFAFKYPRSKGELSLSLLPNGMWAQLTRALLKENQEITADGTSPHLFVQSTQQPCRSVFSERYVSTDEAHSSCASRPARSNYVTRLCRAASAIPSPNFLKRNHVPYSAGGASVLPHLPQQVTPPPHRSTPHAIRFPHRTHGQVRGMMIMITTAVAACALRRVLLKGARCFSDDILHPT